MATYTPGPWALNDNTGRLTGSNGRFVGRLEGTDFAHSTECKANALLITAAPELLTLAQALLDAMDVELPYSMKHCASGERFNLRAAIAKATGGQ
jgi:hypothetical protein